MNAVRIDGQSRRGPGVTPTGRAGPADDGAPEGAGVAEAHGVCDLIQGRVGRAEQLPYRRGACAVRYRLVGCVARRQATTQCALADSEGAGLFLEAGNPGQSLGDGDLEGVYELVPCSVDRRGGFDHCDRLRVHPRIAAQRDPA